MYVTCFDKITLSAYSKQAAQLSDDADEPLSVVHKPPHCSCRARIDVLTSMHYFWPSIPDGITRGRDRLHLAVMMRRKTGDRSWLRPIQAASLGCKLATRIAQLLYRVGVTWKTPRRRVTSVTVDSGAVMR